MEILQHFRFLKAYYWLMSEFRSLHNVHFKLELPNLGWKRLFNVCSNIYLRQCGDLARVFGDTEEDIPRLSNIAE